MHEHHGSLKFSAGSEYFYDFLSYTVRFRARLEVYPETLLKIQFTDLDFRPASGGGSNPKKIGLAPNSITFRPCITDRPPVAATYLYIWQCGGELSSLGARVPRGESWGLVGDRVLCLLAGHRWHLPKLVPLFACFVPMLDGNDPTTVTMLRPRYNPLPLPILPAQHNNATS